MLSACRPTQVPRLVVPVVVDPVYLPIPVKAKVLLYPQPRFQHRRNSSTKGPLGWCIASSPPLDGDPTIWGCASAGSNSGTRWFCSSTGCINLSISPRNNPHTGHVDAGTRFSSSLMGISLSPNRIASPPFPVSARGISFRAHSSNKACRPLAVQTAWSFVAVRFW